MSRISFDVAVIGGGHAGVEAATAAARRGAQVALVCLDAGTIGAMSCNPAIGGIGKGHIVREVDACDGLIARAADSAAIHYRMLNRSKGAAVRGPRVQADRTLFAAAIKAAIAAYPNITILEGEASALRLRAGRIEGLMLADDTAVNASAVVLATGTFLGGRLFRGEDTLCGGRWNERGPSALGRQLRELGLPVGRMKTGTPPRLDGRSIDWAALAEQPSDEERWTMSPMSRQARLPQLRCGIARTTLATHDVIRDAFDRSPLRSGAISGEGPRYCPSIEDKVIRFGDRDGHQVFLEPEGLATDLVYPNGISTSLPVDAQQAFVRSIPGLARATIVLPGYAVEYDHVDPRSLDHSLMAHDIPGLFFAGQINGTTGYEEAAGQGLAAGANAAAYACGLSPLLFDRSESYIGVMIDDLVLQGVTEPYRMLTARAEYRLHLRADNAETRLGPMAEAAGLLSASRQNHQRQRRDTRATVERALAVTVPAREVLGPSTGDGVRRTVADWLAAGIPLADLPGIPSDLDADCLDEAVEDARYRPYRARQVSEVERLRAADSRAVPATLDYAAIPGLSNEMVVRLRGARPSSIGAVSRIRGVTPAAAAAILLHIERRAA